MSTTRARQTALREQIARWNRLHPVGTAVDCQVYPGRVHHTSSPATLMFDRKAVIHLDGFSGYFELDDVRPVASVRRAVLFPGQGAQRPGMGRELFAQYPDQTRLASHVLGYSIERLCLENPDGQLDETRYTQAALFVVNALSYDQHQRDSPGGAPDFLLGHSIGEYNALLAAGVFDFETGLRLVMKRGELMGLATGGAMAAVLGASPERLREVLSADGLDGVDLANYNAPAQTVISGPVSIIERAIATLAAQRIHAVRLRVSGAFHSRYMREAQDAFTSYAQAFTFAPPAIPVIANATGLPYQADRVAPTLCAQITSPVRWMDSVQYVLRQGETEFIEIGSTFLSAMVRKIAAHTAMAGADRGAATSAPAGTTRGAASGPTAG